MPLLLILPAQIREYGLLRMSDPSPMGCRTNGSTLRSSCPRLFRCDVRALKKHREDILLRETHTRRRSAKVHWAATHLAFAWTR